LLPGYGEVIGIEGADCLHSSGHGPEYRSDLDEEGSGKRMIFSGKFFVLAAVLGIALVGISIDPELPNLALEFDYGKFLGSHLGTVSLASLIGIGLVIGLRNFRRRGNRNGDQGSASQGGSYRSSHPYNK